MERNPMQGGHKNRNSQTCEPGEAIPPETFEEMRPSEKADLRNIINYCHFELKSPDLQTGVEKSHPL